MNITETNTTVEESLRLLTKQRKELEANIEELKSELAEKQYILKATVDYLNCFMPSKEEVKETTEREKKKGPNGRAEVTVEMELEIYNEIKAGNFDHFEIADKLGISEGPVEKRIKRINTVFHNLNTKHVIKLNEERVIKALSKLPLFGALSNKTLPNTRLISACQVSGLSEEEVSIIFSCY